MTIDPSRRIPPAEWPCENTGTAYAPSRHHVGHENHGRPTLNLCDLPPGHPGDHECDDPLTGGRGRWTDADRQIRWDIPKPKIVHPDPTPISIDEIQTFLGLR